MGAFATAGNDITAKGRQITAMTSLQRDVRFTWLHHCSHTEAA